MPNKIASIRPSVGRGTPGPDICSVTTELAVIDTNRKPNIGKTESVAFGSDACHGMAVPKTTAEPTAMANASDTKSLSATEVRNRVRTTWQSYVQGRESAGFRHVSRQLHEGSHAKPRSAFHLIACRLS